MIDQKKKSDQLIIRLTPKEKAEFRAACDLMGVSMSELLRNTMSVAPGIAPLFANRNERGVRPITLNDPTGKIQ